MASSPSYKTEHTIGHVVIKKLKLHMTTTDLNNAFINIKSALKSKFRSGGSIDDINGYPLHIPMTLEKAMEIIGKQYYACMPSKPVINVIVNKPIVDSKKDESDSKSDVESDKIPIVTIPSVSAVSDSTTALEDFKNIRNSALTLVVGSAREVEKLNRDLTFEFGQMYEELYQCLHDTTLENMRRLPSFADIESSKCPFKFFKFIKQHLSAGGTSASNLMAGKLAIKKWNDWKWQSEDKTIEAFIDRGRILMSNVFDITGEQISTNMFARRFVAGIMDEPVFSRHIEKLLQDEANSVIDAKSLDITVLAKSATAYLDLVKNTPDNVTTQTFYAKDTVQKQNPRHANSHQKNCPNCKNSNSVKNKCCRECGHCFNTNSGNPSTCNQSDANSGNQGGNGSGGSGNPPNSNSGGPNKHASTASGTPAQGKPENPPTANSSKKNGGKRNQKAEFSGLSVGATATLACLDDDDDLPQFCAYFAASNSQTNLALKTPNSIILDTGLNVSIVHPKFLTNIYKEST